MKNKKLSTKQWNQLVEAAKAGSNSAFEEICRQKSSSILFVCNSVLHNWQDAEDAAQEVLTLVHAKISTLQAPEAFSVWLNKLSYTTSIAMRRKQMKNQYHSPLTDFEDEFQDCTLESLPSELLETKESREMVLKAIKALPTNYRMAMIFHYYDGLKTKEIAEVMNVTEKAAQNYLYRGRLALKESLGDIDSTNHTALPAFLLSLFEKTDLEVAAKRSANVLESMGIAPQATYWSASDFGKTVGGAILCGAILASSLLYVYANAGHFQNAYPAEYAQPLHLSPVSPDMETTAAAPQHSAEDSVSGDKQGDPAQSNTSIMGRIYLYSPAFSTEENPWSVPDVQVQLIPAGLLSLPQQTTRTMQGQYAGWYVFDHVKPGKYKIKINLPHYLKPAFGLNTILEKGFLTYQGQTTFDASQLSALNHSIPVVQTGNIHGQVTASQPALADQLGGLVAQLYSQDGNLLASAVTDAEGHYLFDAPPILKTNWHTIQFYAPDNAQIAFSENQVHLEAEPGKPTVAPEVFISDTTPPSLNIRAQESSDRGQSFTIETDSSQIQWQLYSDAVLLAEGTGSTPKDQLDNVADGRYLLVVTATDKVGNSTSQSAIIALT